MADGPGVQEEDEDFLCAPNICSFTLVLVQQAAGCGLFPTARITLCKKLRKDVSAVRKVWWGAKLQRARLTQFLFEGRLWEVAQGP